MRLTRKTIERQTPWWQKPIERPLTYDEAFPMDAAKRGVYVVQQDNMYYPPPNAPRPQPLEATPVESEPTWLKWHRQIRATITPTYPYPAPVDETGNPVEYDPKLLLMLQRQHENQAEAGPTKSAADWTRWHRILRAKYMTPTYPYPAPVDETGNPVEYDPRVLWKAQSVAPDTAQPTYSISPLIIENR